MIKNIREVEPPKAQGQCSVATRSFLINIQLKNLGATKIPKIGTIVQFYGFHYNTNTKTHFVNVFPCGPDRASLDGHFDVLHDPCWGLPPPNPWSEGPKILKNRPNRPVLWLPW